MKLNIIVNISSASRNKKLLSTQPFSDYGKIFDKILIANRGEIACRIIKTARKMGIKTVAIYSEADAHSLHVQMADESYCVGPAPSTKSYLNIEAILEAIRRSGAQAVHPGYGFLSENFHFCKALDENGTVFIGPSVKAMAQMGDKIESKIIARNAGVHTIPGFDGVVIDAEQGIEIAKKLGYPVMIKASAGGGGKGMRIAWNNEEMRENFFIAAAESKSSFGDDRLLVEKFVEEPRHVEMQILGDNHGNIIYLNERECSIQRRNQKVIEEAPSPALTPDLRQKMGEQAVQLAKQVGYSSAGTVEFLVDKHKKFYFLEMNTRLQVEHPITEYITGIDLVEQMIRVAAGQKLSITQNDVGLRGWAVESRVYAEDPKKFLPSIGKLKKYQEPNPIKEGDRGEIRCDSGVKEGSEISIYYDPLICKLSTHGMNREEALQRMEMALDSYVIKGVTHNIPLLREVISQRRFRDGALTTNYLQEEFPSGFNGHKLSKNESNVLAAACLFVYARQTAKFPSKMPSGDLHIKIAGHGNVTLRYHEDSSVTIGGKSLSMMSDWIPGQNVLNITIQGIPYIFQVLDSPYLGKLRVQAWGTTFDVTIQTPLEHQLSVYMKTRSDSSSDKLIKAPMAGQIVSVSVKVGDILKEGAEIAVIEAMKMQNIIRAVRSGVVKKIGPNLIGGRNVISEELLIEMGDFKN